MTAKKVGRQGRGRRVSSAETHYHSWSEASLSDRWGWLRRCKLCGLEAKSTKGPRGGHVVAYTAKNGKKFGERHMPSCNARRSGAS